MKKHRGFLISEREGVAITTALTLALIELAKRDPDDLINLYMEEMYKVREKIRNYKWYIET